jgi:hypothetical protein
MYTGRPAPMSKSWVSGQINLLGSLQGQRRRLGVAGVRFRVGEGAVDGA